MSSPTRLRFYAKLSLQNHIWLLGYRLLRGEYPAAAMGVTVIADAELVGL